MKAQNKKPEAIDFQTRIKSFKSEMTVLIEKHQVGMRPEFQVTNSKIECVLKLIDIVELKKQQDEEEKSAQ